MKEKKEKKKKEIGYILFYCGWHCDKTLKKKKKEKTQREVRTGTQEPEQGQRQGHRGTMLTGLTGFFYRLTFRHHSYTSLIPPQDHHLQ